MKPSEILSQAADLIEPEGCWTKRTNARDRDGASISPYHDDAACFCAAGAMMKVVGSDGDRDDWRRAYCFLAEAIDSSNVEAWNDKQFKSRVLSSMRAASALAKEQEQSDAL